MLPIRSAGSDGKLKDKTDPSASEVDLELILVEKKRNTLFEFIQTVYENSKKARTDDESRERFLCSVETIDEIRTEFRNLVNEHNILLLKSNPAAIPSYHALISFDDLFGRIKRVLKQVEPVPSRVNQHDSDHFDQKVIRTKRPTLPPIEIMSFDGDIRSWPLFYESYKSTIHENPSLTDAERLYYLIGKLSTKAQLVFSGITPCPTNYQIIMKCLVDRYQDKRVLASTYLDQMINLKINGPASSSNFQSFMDQYVTAANAIKNLEIDDLTDFIFMHIALKKLDGETIRAFESQYREIALPTFSQLTSFIRSQHRIYQNTQPSAAGNSTRNSVKSRSHVPNPQSYVTLTATNKKCLCDNVVHDHLFKCQKFNDMTPSSRFKCVKDISACVNCLGIKHKTRDCNSTLKCRTCHQKHHTMLHFNRADATQSHDSGLVIASAVPATPGARAARSATSDLMSAPVVPTSAISEPRVSSLHTSIAAPSQLSASNEDRTAQCLRPTTVLLSTAQVVIYDNDGKRHLVKCLLDSGSQCNFISSECCVRLGLNCNKNTQMIVRGFGGSEKPIRGSTDFRIFSRFDEDVFYDVSGLVVDRITDDLPTVPVNNAAFTHIKSLQLADSSFANPAPVDVLLGASIFPHLLMPGKVHSNVHGIPPAIQTVLGYILMGSAPALLPCKSTSACCATVQPSLDHLLKRFWELEEVSAPPTHSQDDLECETHFRTTTTRDASGRYTVAFPFRDDVYKLGDSFSTAQRRFLCLEKKLESSSFLRAAYDDIIREYVEKGYVTEIGPIENNISAKTASYFVPHHCVQRLDKTSTKVRMVLDASCKTSTGLSLNDVLHSGPNLQGDLNNILLNFRLFKIAISADCRQMFLQLAMVEKDRKYQRFLFRFRPEDKLSVFELTRVAFGMKSSVFHAIRVVHQLIADEGHKFPAAAAIAAVSTYMDDVCYSIMAADSSQKDESVAIDSCTELIKLFKCGQFDLVKWTSNSDTVLRAIPASHRASSDLEIDKDVPHKILGTHWDRSDDVFKFKVAEPDAGCTKRIILSVVARLWDNLGLVAPVILYAKLLIQELWLLKCDWDEAPPQRITSQWRQFCGELPALNEIRIPRHLGVVQGCVANLIGFADASERAYGSVIYLQVNSHSNLTVRLVCSKSKVAPLKTISIARLELCATVLLSKLMRKVLDNFESRYKISNVFAFTDSKVVLCWINSSPHRWQTFVANRVVKVVDNVPASCFHHVAGVENPADCLSRGLAPALLNKHPLWFTGPPWASKHPSEWPISEFDRENVSEMPELKPLALAVTVNTSKSLIYELAQRISSWSKLLRIIVYMYRFSKILPRRSYITKSDLEFVEIKILSALQHVYFSDDINKLKNDENCSPALQKLKPFLDENGLIRVGGRLTYAALNYTQKHPCVLPRHDHVVDSLIDYYHRKYLHAGPELLMSLLRNQYWILAARRIIRHRIHKCNTCFRAKPRPSFPIMADLPVFRVNQVDKPFTHTGCDYAGPLQYTPVRGRGVKSRKAWLCIFTCLTTRCLHIEIATELSTVNFLAALKRFLSRRGPVQCIYTDNGTNFVGCSSYLRDLYKFLDQHRPHLEHELSESRIAMRRIIPQSPHMGGCWESMVKVVKSHLFKVIGMQILSYEELLTVLTQIEALVNSRPLTAMSSDPAEPSALTPAHFLNTAPLQSLPAAHVENVSLQERHSLLDKMVQSFWQRWRTEYLHQLQSRAKWNTPSTPIPLGSVVVIIVDNAPVFSWPLGVVEAVHTSKDGTTRSLTVRTCRGTLVRPVVRVCLLPSQ